MYRFQFSRSMLAACGICVLLAGTAMVRAQQYDNPQPNDQSQTYDSADQDPGRVARLAYLTGQVQFAPAGENDWGSIDVNRPMVIGDRLLTGDDGRAVLELGDSSIRIDNDSAFDFLNLAQDNVQIELSQGTLNLAVRQLDQGANFEVDTPTVAFVASTPGVYRIDDNPSGTGSMVTVFQGSGTVYGENGVSRQVVAGTSYRFNDSTLASVDVNGLPPSDAFDRFCEARDANYQRYTQQEDRYVSPDMIGGDQLYQYGQWNDTPDYGNVWYPTSVPVGWAPYRYGHWAWIDPWGWTWVDNEPWGFAPFHYGRWVYVRNRWGWMPGPMNVRPVYAPALVAFVGGSGFSLSLNVGGGGPVGWFPLGPRDVYMPWFHASRRYFTNVNVTNIRNVYVNRTVINNFYGDYRRGRVPPRGGHDYAYRRMAGAVTAVPRNVFTDARPVHGSLVKLNRAQLARTQVALRPGVNPGKASLGLRRPTPRPTVFKGREPFARPVVARHQPPPRPVGFAARQKIIASQHGQPLSPAQIQNLRREHPANDARDARRVKVVPVLAGAAAGAAAFGAMHHGAAPSRPTGRPAQHPPQRPVVAPHPSGPVVRGAGPQEPPFRNTVHPIRAPNNPARATPPRPNELPSARFAHPREPATLPRAAKIRPAGTSQHGNPASNRLPVVRPVERAPQSAHDRVMQQQRQVDTQSQQRERAQQLQRQRQTREQAQQRAREQQMQQQRQVQMQAQQRERATQQQRLMQQQRQEQQQRQAQMQAQQREREQAMQQQRAMQVQQQQQRAMEVQRQQQMRAREVQRVPQPRNRQAPERREPPRKHPPESSSGGNPMR